MNNTRSAIRSRNSSSNRWHRLALVSVLVLAGGPALAVDRATRIAAQARYEQEREMCVDGQTAESLATCMREAGAALAQARRGQLDDGDAPYALNARRRCDVLVGSDRDACLERMNGQGSTSGSVASGGIYRELVTTVPAASAPAATK